MRHRRIDFDINQLTGCWEIKSHTPEPNGYIRICIKRKNFLLHRMSYESFYGPIPDGLVICHSCDNRRCINPEHLSVGTHKENSQDAVRKNRQAKGVKTNHRNKLTEAQVKEIFLSNKMNIELAVIYKVHPMTVSRIKNKRIWKWIHD